MSERSQIAPAWNARLAACGVDDLRRMLDNGLNGHAGGAWQALTKPGLGGRERWRWELQGDPGDTLYLKRYRRPPLRVQWDRWLRQEAGGSAGRWEYCVLQRLHEAHIPAPQPVGFAEAMSGWLERRSLVVLAAVPGDAFDRCWQRLVAEGAPVTYGVARHDVVARLARFIAAFHGTGICHRDLYLCHVFTDLDPRGERRPSFTLIDLARAHRPRWRRMRWIIKDLAQLDASARGIGATRSDRMRFLRHYLGLEPRAPRLRWYARRVARKSDWIVARIQRKSRAA